jgi:hypothetical protein
LAGRGVCVDIAGTGVEGALFVVFVGDGEVVGTLVFVDEEALRGATSAVKMRPSDEAAVGGR